MQDFFQITSQPIIPQEIIQKVESTNCGAVNVFIGTVRNWNQQKKVVRLEYESYEPMALKKIEEIAGEVKKKWPVEKIAVSHRVGHLNIGEIAVVVAVSTPHRKESFEACQYMIDTLKKIVPIWKKEIYEDGEVWIAAHP